jgi:hypothetical protein
VDNPAKKKVDDILFAKASPELRERQRQVRKEMRAAARRKWRDNNLQERPLKRRHEGEPER